MDSSSRTGETGAAVSGISRVRALRLEVCAVVLCFVLPSILSGLLYPYYRHVGLPSSGSLSYLLSGVGEGAIAIFLMWASGDRMAMFGFRRPLWLRDVLVGMVVGAAFVLFHDLERLNRGPRSFEAWRFLADIVHGHVIHQPGWAALVILSTVASAFSQELIFRGLLLVRIEELTGKTWLAVLLSAGLFMCIHIYQGVAYRPQHLVFGLLTGFAFAGTRNLLPVTLAHTLANLSITLYF